MTRKQQQHTRTLKTRELAEYRAACNPPDLDDAQRLAERKRRRDARRQARRKNGS